MTEIHQAPSTHPIRILLAEDDGDFRELVALKLRNAGFDVTEVHDGKDLLTRLTDSYPQDTRNEPFDMVLSDINMPHFSALDVMVGARSCLTTTPIVLMTSFGDAHTRTQAMQLGAAAVLDKPLQLEELPAKLTQFLNDHEVPDFKW